MKKPKPLWPITYRRAARWLGCHPRTVSRFAQGQKVTYAVFRNLIHQGVGNANGRWIPRLSHVAWVSAHAEVGIYPSHVSVGEFCPIPLPLIREAFHCIEGKQALLSFAEIAEKFGIPVADAEAAIRFPW